MPALSLFGHKTCLAGDDLFLSSVFFICMRLLQLAVLIPLTLFEARVNQRDYSACPDDVVAIDNAYPIFISYISMSYPLFVAGLTLEVGIGRAALKGTPTQPELRRNVQRLCHVKLVFQTMLRIIVITLGLLSVVILKRYCNCVPDNEELVDLLQTECDTLDTYRTYFMILVSTHIIEAVSTAVLIVYFLCKCTPNAPQLASAETKWSICCHCCMSTFALATCCCLGGRQAGDFSDIATVLADYFDDEGTLDVVPSDIIVALLMLMRVQTEQRDACVQHVLEQAKEHQQEDANVDLQDDESGNGSSEDEDDHEAIQVALAELNQTTRQRRLNESVVFRMDRSDNTGRVYFRPLARKVLSKTSPDDRMAIAEGARFMRYARAMYSWKMDVIEKPVLSCGSFGLQFLSSLRMKRHGNVCGDNWFGMNEKSLQSFANLDAEQIVYASFTEGLSKIPFCVVIDNEWKSVVISIRGTLSLEDAVTDVSLSPISLEECGDRCGFDGRLCYAHRGMLTTCEWVYNELERLELLDDLLLKNDAPYAGYKLRVTGHSLGAGCAAILSLMLRRKFPDLKALCFSPPGCVLSEAVSEKCKDFMTSYVLDTDIVPRLSQESMEHLRDDVLEMIARIKVSKCDAVIASRGRGKETLDDLLYSKSSIPPSKFHDELNEFRMRYERKKENRPMLNVRLVPPGHIVHMVNTGFGTSRMCRPFPFAPTDHFYTARWIEANDLREIIISARLLDDHNPLNVLTELEYIAENEYGLCSPFLIPDENT